VKYHIQIKNKYLVGVSKWMCSCCPDRH